MNQILSIEQPKKEIKQKVKSNEPIEINKIVKFFAISMIIFGIVIISSASYSMYKGTQVGNTQAKPTIYVEDISESVLYPSRIFLTSSKSYKTIRKSNL